MGTIILSALVAHTAWHWMIDRAVVLRQYRFQWPALDAALLASAARWMMVLVILFGAIWFAFGALRNRMERGQESKPARVG
jgi:hypothetical protein